MEFVIGHILLWLSWKLTALWEKKTRLNGKKIPVYFTGDFANPIAFSALFYLWSIELPVISNLFMFISLFLVFILDQYGAIAQKLVKVLCHYIQALVPRHCLVNYIFYM